MTLVRMWRGQSLIDWTIDSSAFRRISIEGKKITENDIITYEERLLKQAKFKGYHIVDGRYLSDFELLALLQHNGASTRLVDFTRSALIGLWFCVSSHKNETGLLLGAHAYYLGGHEGKSEQRTYNEVIDRLTSLDHPMTWEPTSITPRVASQHSQFLYSSIVDSIYGSLKLSSYANANLFIAINPDLKIECKEILIKVFDIREQTLFPDLSGFGDANNSFKSLDEMYRW